MAAATATVQTLLATALPTRAHQAPALSGRPTRLLEQTLLRA
jgi:hypothetical protein